MYRYNCQPMAGFWPRRLGKSFPRGANAMATVLSGKRLLDAIRNGTMIQNGSEHCAEGVKYDFRMGNRLLLRGRNGPIDASRLQEVERSQLYLEPGEVAFVLTEESLALPDNVVATLSPKRKLSHDGVLVLGGFFIDAGYPGNLLVGLYNFSTARWPLRPGKKLIAAVFYELEESELAGAACRPDSITDFPEDLVRLMQNYQPIGLAALQAKIHETQKSLSELSVQFHTQDDWKKNFQQSLESHDRQIAELLKGIAEIKDSLTEERKNREAADKDASSQISAVSAQLNQIDERRHSRTALRAGVIGAVIGAIISALVSFGLSYSYGQRFQRPAAPGVSAPPVSGTQH